MTPFKSILIVAWFSLMWTVGTHSQPSPATDYGMLTTAFEHSLNALLSACPPPTEEAVVLKFPGGLRLSPAAQKTAESLFTNAGFTLAPDEENTGPGYSLTVTEARIVYERTGGRFTRIVTVTVHLTATDSRRRALFRSEQGEILSDSLPAKTIRLTDDCDRFSPSLNRTILSRKRSFFRSASLAVITGTLVYLAFQ